MAVKIACFLPHPPILIPEIGGKEIDKIQDTVDAMRSVSCEVASVEPQTCVFISPHSLAFADAFALKTQPTLRGSMARFGAGQVSFSAQNDQGLVSAILEEASDLDIAVCQFGKELVDTGYSDALDHGVLIPLYYFEEMRVAAIISLSVSGLSYFKHYLLGLAIQKAADQLGRNVAVLASGDLSHRLTPNAPGGFNERGKDFDETVRDIFRKGSFEDFFKVEKSLVKDAGECGFRSLFVLAGALNGYEVQTEVFSYEGPFGVGYMVATAKPIKQEGQRDMIEKIGELLSLQRQQAIRKESAPVRLARRAIESYVKDGSMINPPDDVSDFLLEKQGAVFVSLKKDGRLRGCIGTTEPAQPSLAEEIIKNAIHAATKDPRFSPVEPRELSDLVYSVDILEEPEEISDESFLDPRKYGVIVESGWNKGLLLPDIEGVDTVEDQVAIAKRKAGLRSSDQVSLYRFKVKRYE